jgi:26S proteasome regulatory subunit N3
MDAAQVVAQATTLLPLVPAAPFPKDPLDPSARPVLLNLFRSLSLRHDELGQEVVLNAILRNLIHAKLFEQAEQILTLSNVRQPYRSTNQAARAAYYDGLIKAMRLDYTGARFALGQALRKAPERALGFRVAVTKLHLVVQLLLGEIPPRSDFLVPAMKEALAPYLALTSCVRFGALGRFQSLADKHKADFEADRTLSLILRVRQNVIRMGLARIGNAYARITFNDIGSKLALDNRDDAEYIVAKAIRDGALKAYIDHEAGHVVAVSAEDVYATTEPLRDLDKRVKAAGAIHDDARRALRFLGDAGDEEEEARKEQEKRAALARALEDENQGDVDFSEGI